MSTSPPETQPSELEILTEARKAGRISDSDRLRLTELMKEAEDEKNKPKPAPEKK